jgi:hypothetical protein
MNKVVVVFLLAAATTACRHSQPQDRMGDPASVPRQLEPPKAPSRTGPIDAAPEAGSHSEADDDEPCELRRNAVGNWECVAENLRELNGLPPPTRRQTIPDVVRRPTRLPAPARSK